MCCRRRAGCELAVGKFCVPWVGHFSEAEMKGGDSPCLIGCKRAGLLPAARNHNLKSSPVVSLLLKLLARQKGVWVY